MGFDPISSGIDLIGKVIDKLFPDKNEAEKAKAKLQELTQTGELSLILGQLEISKEEAKSEKWWKAGARPFVIWTCGAGFAWQYVIGPIFQWLSTLAGHPTPLPILDVATLQQLLFAILGLGSMRMYEKVRKSN